MGSALNHDLVCDGEQLQQQRSSTAVVEARRLAQRAATALRESQERRARENVSLPTWTGRCGTAGAPAQRRFGGALNSRLLGANGGAGTSAGASVGERGTFFSQGRPGKAPIGSSAILQRIEERKAAEPGANDPDSESSRLLGKLCQFFKQHSGRCTSLQLSTRFKLDNVDAVLLRQLLREVASKDSDGLWVLKQEYMEA